MRRSIEALICVLFSTLVLLAITLVLPESTLVPLFTFHLKSMKHQTAPRRMSLLGTDVVNYNDAQPYFPQWDLTGDLRLDVPSGRLAHTPNSALYVSGTQGTARLEFPVLNGQMVFRGRVRINNKSVITNVSVYAKGNKTLVNIPIVSLDRLSKGHLNQWVAFRVPVTLPYDSWRNYLVFSLQGKGYVALDDLQFVRLHEDYVVAEKDFKVIQDFPGAKVVQ